MVVPKKEHAKKVSIKDYVNKKPTGSRTMRENSEFYFRGFYDRLKSLDVK
jgi:hypothetical protein